MGNKKMHFKCWICKDQGLVFFTKYKYGIAYEFAYRCTCMEGQKSGNKIMAVPSILAENIAIENYKNFIAINPCEILSLKEKLLSLDEIPSNFTLA